MRTDGSPAPRCGGASGSRTRWGRSLGEAHLVNAALFTLETDAAPAALFTLLVVLERHRVPNADKALRPLLGRWNERGMASTLASRRM